jgi:hypothetical protein
MKLLEVHFCSNKSTNMICLQGIFENMHSKQGIKEIRGILFGLGETNCNFRTRILTENIQTQRGIAGVWSIGNVVSFPHSTIYYQ